LALLFYIDIMEKRPWTAEEDRLLKYVFESSRLSKWSHIARRLQEEHGVKGRNGKQCKERYTRIYAATHSLTPSTAKRNGAMTTSRPCLNYTITSAISGQSLALASAHGT
jgi:hypothetical protein